MNQKRVLLKLTGEAFISGTNQELSPILLNSIIKQVKYLAKRIQFGIVVGGGNFFRGSQHGKKMNITPTVGHNIGILATLMNGLMLKDLLEQNGIKTALFSAITCPEIAASISAQAVQNAREQTDTIVFAGGIGTPFFSTDTTAVIRALQINADEIWKASHIDGVYTADPRTDITAQFLPNLTFEYALQKKLAIMDSTAFSLANQHKKSIRVFSIFEKDALIKAAEDPKFGSLIHV